MNLLVTGGAGFIGSTFVAQRIAGGDKVVVLDALTYAGHRENLDWINAPAGMLELVVGNICDTPLVIDLLRSHAIDAVVHFAAESHVDNSIHSPAAFIETNVHGTYSMLEAARTYWNDLPDSAKKAFRFIQISTDEVYGSLGEEGYFTEDSKMKPNSPYSASKASGDLLARAWFKTYGLPVITTNCTNNYGPRQHPEKLIPRMITNALAGARLPIYGSGKNVRDWIHVEDHCSGVYLALTRGAPGQTYCFSGGQEKTNLEIVHTVCDILDKVRPKENGASYREQIAFVADRPGHDWRYAIDDTKAQKELGYNKKYQFTEGLEATLNWYLENSDWCISVTKKAA